MKKVDIYTDGSCSGNPGPGGWGAILIYKGIERELSGGEPDTTNNRMELQAAISALELLKERCEVTLYTDSKYIEQALNAGWLKNWKRKGWKKSDNSPVANIDLWQKLDALLTQHSVELRWVKGHAENELNNRCDALATLQTKMFSRA